MIEDWIMRRGPRARLVIVDVFEKVRTRQKGSSSCTSYQDDYAAYGPLTELVKKHKTSIVLLTHTTKGKADDVFDQILGSAGTQGPADTFIVISKQPGRRNERVVSIRGKDVEERHLAFAIEGKFRWTFRGNADEHRMGYERQAIADLLEDEGRQMTNQEIKNSLRDSGIKSVDMLLSKLVRDGEIEKCGYGKYAKAGFTDERLAHRATGRG